MRYLDAKYKHTFVITKSSENLILAPINFRDKGYFHATLITVITTGGFIDHVFPKFASLNKARSSFLCELRG